MSQILLYIIIMGFGMMLSQKKLVPVSLQKRLNRFQTLALFILIGAMGYKIGVDDKILLNFKNLGIESFIFAICTGGGSIIVTFIFFKIINRMFKQKGGR